MLNISGTASGNPLFLPTGLIKVLHGEDKHMQLNQKTQTHTHTHIKIHKMNSPSSDKPLLTAHNDETLLNTMTKQQRSGSTVNGWENFSSYDIPAD